MSCGLAWLDGLGTEEAEAAAARVWPEAFHAQDLKSALYVNHELEKVLTVGALACSQTTEPKDQHNNSNNTNNNSNHQDDQVTRTTAANLDRPSHHLPVFIVLLGNLDVSQVLVDAVRRNRIRCFFQPTSDLKEEEKEKLRGKFRDEPKGATLLQEGVDSLEAFLPETDLKGVQVRCYVTDERCLAWLDEKRHPCLSDMMAVVNKLKIKIRCSFDQLSRNCSPINASGRSGWRISRLTWIPVPKT